MFEANNEKEYRNESCHLVLICDETGIIDTFKKIKDNLAGRNKAFLSLVYVTPSDILNPLFERELSILGEIYSHNIFIHTVKTEPGEYEQVQESIEVILNSNTNSNIQFSVSGNPEFVDYVSGVLGYLNVETQFIESNIK